MSFKEWLRDQLIEEGFIDEDEYDLDDMTESLLLSSTEVDESDLENYKAEFEEHCSARQQEPIWDLE